MFQTILFDIDGVMLSEERYFDASALTVYELLSSPKYIGLSIPELPPFSTDLEERDIREVRKTVFANDSVLRTMKQCGVNANWDMVYLQTAFQITEVLCQLKSAGVDILSIVEITQDGWSRPVLTRIGQLIRESKLSVHFQFDAYAKAYETESNKQTLFRDVVVRLKQAVSDKVGPFDYENVLWNVGQQCFQEWYLGDEYNPANSESGKCGFLTDEVPIVSPDKLSSLFVLLKSKGLTIGVGTGRPYIETSVPLESFGWLKYFDSHRISTASDVLDAEARVPAAAPLSKPHPYAYLRSYLREQDAKKVLKFPLPLSSDIAEEVLVVGDSVADLLAARSIGCKFAAVLTGLEGEAARQQFEELHADFILSDVLELKNMFD